MRDRIKVIPYHNQQQILPRIPDGPVAVNHANIIIMRDADNHILKGYPSAP